VRLPFSFSTPPSSFNLFPKKACCGQTKGVDPSVEWLTKVNVDNLEKQSQKELRMKDFREVWNVSSFDLDKGVGMYRVAAVYFGKTFTLESVVAWKKMRDEVAFTDYWVLQTEIHVDDRLVDSKYKKFDNKGDLVDAVRSYMEGVEELSVEEMAPALLKGVQMEWFPREAQMVVNNAPGHSGQTEGTPAYGTEVETEQNEVDDVKEIRRKLQHGGGSNWDHPHNLLDARREDEFFEKNHNWWYDDSRDMGRMEYGKPPTYPDRHEGLKQAQQEVPILPEPPASLARPFAPQQVPTTGESLAQEIVRSVSKLETLPSELASGDEHGKKQTIKVIEETLSSLQKVLQKLRGGFSGPPPTGTPAHF